MKTINHEVLVENRLAKKKDLVKILGHGELKAHELSHALTRKAGIRCNHGLQFYQIFSVVCPEEYQHFELNYKPRNAKRFGVKALN